MQQAAEARRQAEEERKQAEAARKAADETLANFLGDPIQKAAFLQFDAEALEQQRRTGQFERYEERHDRIAGMVQGRFGARQSIADKAERKRAMLTSLPVAFTKAHLPEHEDDSEPDVRETIAEMAKARGQSYALTERPLHAPEIVAIDPFGKMPVLRHDDFALFESKAIATYLDRDFAGPCVVPSASRPRCAVPTQLGAMRNGAR